MASLPSYFDDPDEHIKQANEAFSELGKKKQSQPSLPMPAQDRDSYADDLVDSFQSGFYNTTGSILGGARQLLTDDQTPWNIEQSQYDAAQRNIEEIDPQRLAEMNKWGFGEDDEITLSNTGMQLANVGGSFLPSMVGGGVPGAALKLGAKTAKLGKTAQATAQALGYGAGGAAMIGGATAKEVGDTIEAMTPEQLSKFPEYQNLLKQTGDPIKAKAQFKYQQEQTAAKRGAGVGAISMGFGGPAMERVLLKAGQGPLGRIGTGALVEGAQEGFEEGGQARISNPLVGRPEWEGVGERALEGSVLGAGSGATVGGVGAGITYLDERTRRKETDIPVMDDQGDQVAWKDVDTGETYSPLGGIASGAQTLPVGLGGESSGVETLDPNLPASELNVDNTGLPRSPDQATGVLDKALLSAGIDAQLPYSDFYPSSAENIEEVIPSEQQTTQATGTGAIPGTNGEITRKPETTTGPGLEVQRNENANNEKGINEQQTQAQAEETPVRETQGAQADTQSETVTQGDRVSFNTSTGKQVDGEVVEMVNDKVAKVKLDRNGRTVRKQIKLLTREQPSVPDTATTQETRKEVSIEASPVAEQEKETPKTVEPAGEINPDAGLTADVAQGDTKAVDTLFDKAKQNRPGKVIGKNDQGETIHEDDNGKRYIPNAVKPGQRFTEMDDFRGKRFKTADEMAQEDSVKTDVDAAADNAALSPNNDLPEPSQAMKEAGNYKKAHVKVQGMDVSIENPKGSERKGIDNSGKEWSIQMNDHYGYFKATTGFDKDHLDVFLGPGSEQADKVYVIDQVHPGTGKFDEHKVLMGYESEQQAKDAYESNYDKDWKGLSNITEMPLEEFKQWAYSDAPKKGALKTEQQKADPGKEQEGSSEQSRQEAEAKKEPDIKKPVKSETMPDSDITQETKQQEAKSDESPKINQEFGEKIGGARRDVSVKTGKKTSSKPKDERPAWQRRYEVRQLVAETARIRKSENLGKWFVHDKRKERSLRNYFDSEQEAVDSIPLAEVARNHTVRSGKNDSGDIEYRIDRDVTDRKRVTLKDGFQSRDEAMKYMAKHAVELIETKTRIDASIHPALTEAIRKGEQKRKGDRNVSTDDFQEVFGFRGGEFGNWINSAEGQHILNQAYDALLDMADMLNVPPKALSLNGELAIAFGARGHGLSGASAHYEKDYAAINLTKIKGAGSLAHEWLHAFDHYLGRQANKASSEKISNRRGDKVFKISKVPDNDFVSHGFGYRYEGNTRPELKEAFDKVMNAIQWRKIEFKEDVSLREQIESGNAEKLSKELKAFRDSMARDYTKEKYKYFRGKKNHEPASPVVLKQVDQLVKAIESGNYGETTVELPTQSRSGWSIAPTVPAKVAKLAELYKKLRGRQAYRKDNQGRWGGSIIKIHHAIQSVESAKAFAKEAKKQKIKTKKVKSNYYSEAWAMDQGARKDYWSTAHELAARSFESYIYDKLKDIDARNDFLAYEKHNDLPEYKIFNAKPFPEGKERDKMNAAWDDLFNTIKTKQTSRGTALYSKKSGLSGLYGKVVKYAKKVLSDGGHKEKPLVIGKISQDEANAIKESTGLNVSGYTREWDAYGVKHAYKRHSNQSSRLKSNELPIDENSFALAIDAIKTPDSITLMPGDNRNNNQVIERRKKLDDGSIIYLEEVRTGRKKLVLSSLRIEKPSTTDAEAPSPTSESGTGYKFSIDQSGENVNQGQTKAQLDAELKRQFGPRLKNIVTLGRQDELPGHLLRSNETTKWAVDADEETISGVYDPVTGQIYLVAENINPEDTKGVLMHETVHSTLYDSPAYQDALTALDKMKGSRLYRKAEQAAIDAGTAPEDMQEEILAYYIQNHKGVPFIRRLINQFRQWLRKTFGWTKVSMSEVYQLVESMAKRDPNAEFVLNDGRVMAMSQKSVQPSATNETGPIAPTFDDDMSKELEELSNAIERGEEDFSRASIANRVSETLFKNADQDAKRRVAQTFQQWFADSKAVEPDGYPVVFYYRGYRPFKEIFTEAELGKKTKDALSGIGYFSSIEPEETFGPHETKLFARTENPYLTASKETLAKELQANGYPNTFEGHINFREEVLKPLGFDSIYFENNGWLAVFDPNQYKHATENIGEFSRTDDRVRFSKKKAKITDPNKELNQRIREQHKSAWLKAKKILKRNLTPGGLLPKDVQNLRVTRDNNLGAIEIDIGELNRRLEKAVEVVYKKPVHKLTKAQQQVINDALGGKISNELLESIKVPVIAMRQYIDKMSVEYAQMLFDEAQQLASEGKDEAAVAKAALLETIAGNIGSYINRSYKAFDDPKWYRKVPDQILNNARSYLNSRYQALENPPGNIPEYVEATINTILKEGTAFDNMEAFIKESKLGAKDLSILKRRKDIAPEIRALMGEYQDPRITFTKSATKMSRLIFNQRFLDQVKEIGMGSFLFNEKDRPADAYKKIASGENYKPLDGLYTYPEVEQAFQDALGKETLPDWYRTIVQVNGLVKYGKTVLSPTTAARNWMSAFFFSMANGHFNMKHMAKSIKNMRQYFKHEGDMTYIRELKELGVVYDTPYAGEMMKLLDDSKIEDKYLSGNMAVKDIMGLFTKFYQYGDDFWKIIGYENEINLLMKHKGMTREQAKPLAAKRIRDTYPTYSMTGRWVQKLRRFPLAGTFVSFPAEIIRTSFNIMKLLQQDMKDPQLKALARRRMAGLAIASGFTYALQALFMSIHGIDDDEEEAIRNLAAPWNKNSNILPVGRDKKGNIRFVDLSFLDPYNYWKRPINAIMRDQPAEEIIKESAREILVPFFGQDILFSAIDDIWNNKKDSGGRVYNPAENAFENTWDMAMHLRKSVQPGAASLMERTFKALEGEKSPSGKAYKLSDEMWSAFGWRITTFDPKSAIYYKSFEFADELRDASNILNKAAKNPNKVTDKELLSAYRNAKKSHKEAFDNMIKLVNAAKKSGLSNAEIFRLLRNNRISMRNASALIRGKIPEWKPSRAFLSSTIKRSRSLFDADTRREFIRRRQLIMSQ